MEPINTDKPQGLFHIRFVAKFYELVNFTSGI
jgi:hypothetical protein